MLFNFERLYFNRGIMNRAVADGVLAKFITESLKRNLKGDWGELWPGFSFHFRQHPSPLSFPDLISGHHAAHYSKKRQSRNVACPKSLPPLSYFLPLPYPLSFSHLAHHLSRYLYLRPPPTSRTKYRRIQPWTHEKADTDIARAANKLWRREFCWKDIAKLRFTAFQLKSARSFAEQTLKGQVAAVQNGSPLKYRKVSYLPATGRRVEPLKEGIPVVTQLTQDRIWPAESLGFKLGTPRIRSR